MAKLGKAAAENDRVYLYPTAEEAPALRAMEGVRWDRRKRVFYAVRGADLNKLFKFMTPAAQKAWQGQRTAMRATDWLTQDMARAEVARRTGVAQAPAPPAAQPRRSRRSQGAEAQPGSARRRLKISERRWLARRRPPDSATGFQPSSARPTAAPPRPPQRNVAPAPRPRSQAEWPTGRRQFSFAMARRSQRRCRRQADGHRCRRTNRIRQSISDPDQLARHRMMSSPIPPISISQPSDAATLEPRHTGLGELQFHRTL